MRVASYEVVPGGEDGDGDRVSMKLIGGGSMTVSLDVVDRIVDDEYERPVLVKPDEHPRGRAGCRRGPLSSRLLRKSSLSSPSPYSSQILAAAKEHRVDPAFIAAVIRAESNGVPTAVSRKGARGLMQLMPATARRLGVRRPFDPKENIRGGTAYLAELAARYGDTRRRPRSRGLQRGGARRGGAQGRAALPRDARVRPEGPRVLGAAPRSRWPRRPPSDVPHGARVPARPSRTRSCSSSSRTSSPTRAPPTRSWRTRFSPSRSERWVSKRPLIRFVLASVVVLRPAVPRDGTPSLRRGRRASRPRRRCGGRRGPGVRRGAPAREPVGVRRRQPGARRLAFGILLHRVAHGGELPGGVNVSPLFVVIASFGAVALGLVAAGLAALPRAVARRLGAAA